MPAYGFTADDLRVGRHWRDVPEGAEAATLAADLAAELRTLATPHIEAYRTDLDHDERWIAENPGVPFLHWTRALGTHLVGLLPREALPAEGERVAFLFGTADWRHIVRSALSMAKAIGGGQRLVLYFDGRKLRKIDEAKALDLARAYVTRMLRD